MTTQQILEQLAAGNFQVQVPYDIPGATSRVGTIQEIHMFGKDAACAVFFPGTKWNIIFHVKEGTDKKGRYTRDLHPVVPEEDLKFPIIYKRKLELVLGYGFYLGSDTDIYGEFIPQMHQYIEGITAPNVERSVATDATSE